MHEIYSMGCGDSWRVVERGRASSDRVRGRPAMAMAMASARSVIATT
jgi:hypothetical protein